MREDGVPVEGDPGRGGGIRLDPLRSIPPVRLDLDEVLGLVFGVAMVQAAGPTPFGDAAGRAVGKVLATLPAGRAMALKRALDRVVRGPPASDAVVAGLHPTTDEVIRAFEVAFTQSNTLRFGYTDRHGLTSERHAEPHGLLSQWPAWYLLAIDLDRGAPRMFRLDRMNRPVVTQQRFMVCPLAVFEPLVAPLWVARFG
jgi:predicted DNA-binding transcriptional regulator YafY